jgi:hypothetical protein
MILTATLLWGGCLSCSQYFMFPSAGEKSCCNPAGECIPAPNSQSDRQPSSQECFIQPVELSGVPSTLEHASIVLSSAAILPVQSFHLAPLPLSGLRETPQYSEAVSPPDLCLLHSVFRI